MSQELLTAARRMLEERSEESLLRLSLAVQEHDLAEMRAALESRDAEVRTLRACVDELQREAAEARREADEAAREVERLKAISTQRGHEVARLLNEPRVVMAGKPRPEPCPHCGRADFTGKISRSQHINYCPQNPARKGKPGRHAEPLPPSHISEPPDDPEYHCPMCKSRAFARAIGRDMCVRCARVQEAA